MKTRRSILSLIFGAAAAPAAVAVAKAMPEAAPEVVGTIRRMHFSELSERAKIRAMLIDRIMNPPYLLNEDGTTIIPTPPEMYEALRSIPND